MKTNSREGFGTWIAMAVTLVLILCVIGAATNTQNRGVTRLIAESYLGHEAVQIAQSAIEEAYYRLHHGELSPSEDSRVKMDWLAYLAEVPDGTRPQESIPPDYVRYRFQEAPDRPTDFNVEEIKDVKLSMIHAAADAGSGFQSGAVEFEATARLRMGAFPTGVSVTRTVRVRKRYCTTLADSALSPELRFMESDICREVVRQ